MAKTALVLEGGALRALYSAGVLDVFMKNGIKFDTIIGVSAGALFGFNYKSRQIGRALRYNLKYARDKRYMGVYSFLTTGNIMNEEFCFHELVYKLDKVDFETYKNSPVEFYAVLTNLETGKPEYIEIADAARDMEYLRASGSMPFLSKIVEINGEKYLDGAISDAIPLQKALEMGFEKIVVVLTRPENYKKEKLWMPYRLFYGKYPEFVKTGENSPLRYNETLDFIKNHEIEGKIVVLRPTKDLKVRRIEKNLGKLQAIYDLGVENCQAKLGEIQEYLS